MARSTNRFASIASLFLFSLAMSANAAVQTYTTEASFIENSTGVFVRNFEGIAQADPGSLLINALPLTLSGSGPVVSIGSNASPNNVIVFTGGQIDGYDQAFFLSRNFGPTNEITISVANPGVTALGFVYGSTSTVDTSFSVTVMGSAGAQAPLLQLTSLQFPAAILTPSFIGFTSSAPILSVVFSANDVSHLNVLQVSTGTSALPVPEPSTYAMFGAGLALFGMIGRRRSRKP